MKYPIPYPMLRLQDSEVEAQQMRQYATPAYQALGIGDPPSPNQAEDVTVYRRRLLEPVRQWSPAWRGASQEMLKKLSTDGGIPFKSVEAQIYADAYARGMTTFCPGELREMRSVDETNRPIIKFIGDPEACWGPFKQPGGPRKLLGFKGEQEHFSVRDF